MPFRSCAAPFLGRRLRPTLDLPVHMSDFGSALLLLSALAAYGLLAPGYFSYWVIKRKRENESSAPGSTYLWIWLASLAATVLYVFSGAWYSEHSSDGTMDSTPVIIFVVYVLLPIAGIVRLEAALQPNLGRVLWGVLSILVLLCALAFASSALVQIQADARRAPLAPTL